MKSRDLCIFFLLLLLICSLCFTIAQALGQRSRYNYPTVECNETELVQYLEELEMDYSTQCHVQQLARWNFVTNITEDTRQQYVSVRNDFMAFQAEVQNEIIERFSECNSYPDDFVQRELKFLHIHGPGNMSEADLQQVTELISSIEAAYATTKLCEYLNPDNCELHLEPEIETKLQYAKDTEELEWYWTQWHDEINKVINVSDFDELVQLQNAMANANGFSDMSELWLQSFDDGTEGWTASNFKETVKSLWNELRPLYSKLQAFVRMQLRALPENEGLIKRFGFLPIHLTRHMWSQNWVHLDETTKPFPDVPTLDATVAMQNAGFSVNDLFRRGEELLTSIGLEAMPQEFWDNSILQRPDGTDGREFLCKESAEDMCSGSGNMDFRLKLCANVTMRDLLRASKLTGFVEYFLQYSSLRYIFRSAANPAFFEGLSNAFAMVMSTPHHLECNVSLDLGLELDCGSSELPSDISINYLFRTALEKFPLLSVSIAMDLWKWEVYEGQIPPELYNARWSEVRQEYQGVTEPTQRDHAEVFDIAAIYGAISEQDEYINYFIGSVLQFQFYEAFCIAAGEFDPGNNATKPLHQCDFTGSSVIGDLISEVMSHGFNTSWPELLELSTGRREISAAPLIRYFEPLFTIIDERLTSAGEIACFGKDCQEYARQYVQQEYEVQASTFCNDAALASWNYQTDLTNPEAEAENANASLRYSEFLNREWKERISQFEYEMFEESDEKRQLKFLNAVGVSALETVKLEEYNQVLSEMSRIYGTAKVCPYNNRDCDKETEGLSLEPDLESILASSRHYNELAYIWRAWRDETGKPIRERYNR